MTKVFIDGSAGTTGLRIYERLGERKDLELIILPDEIRKDLEARRSALNSCDIAFLCLPDAAAKEAVSLISNPNVKVIDTSTAHRTNDDWAYGFPEIAQNREKIKNSNRIANPGCHASGFIALVAPIINAGIIPKNALLTCHSITGYSGGGKKMIAEYEDKERSPLLSAPRQYALGGAHKHLPEMAKVCGLENAPAFQPIVADFYSGMEVTVPLFACEIKGKKQDIISVYKEYYKNGLITYKEDDEQGFMSAAALSGRDDMIVSVVGSDDCPVLIARFDNLGKGASGAAIQNMNIILGIDETMGLKVAR